MCVVATGWLVHRGGARASSSIKWDFIQGGPRLSDFCFLLFARFAKQTPLTAKAPFDLLKISSCYIPNYSYTIFIQIGPQDKLSLISHIFIHHNSCLLERLHIT